MEPGLNRDRGVILRQLCDTNKLVYRKYLQAQKITDEEFSAKIQECMTQFTESQKCNSMLVKKQDS